MQPSSKPRRHYYPASSVEKPILEMPRPRRQVRSRSPSNDPPSTDDGEKIDTAYTEEYGRKLELIEEIRQEVEMDDVKTPGIVVIGSQSAGKSSVLERLTGISFPSGENICTRTPTIVHTNTDAHEAKFSALISDNAAFSSAKECTSMTDLQAAISDMTKKLSHGSTSISSTPIYIRHTRRAGPVMTLIDLPGITHLDPMNDKFDIHAATSDIVHEYVKDDSMIILVVIPATDDFANSEALRIAQTYDPAGVRTIGVVSKCDMVPHNADILEKMNMKRASDIKLALGFIAVRNRAPEERGHDVDELEERLFSSHPLLRKLKPAQRGIDAVATRVVAMQGDAVDSFFTRLRSQMWDRKHAMKAELDRLPSIPKTSDERRDILTDVLSGINRKVADIIQTEDVSEPEMNIPARTYELCKKFATDILARIPNCLHKDYVDKVREKQREGMGRLLPTSEIDTVTRQQVREILFGNVRKSGGDGIVQKSTEDLINSHMDFLVSCFERIINEETDQASFPMLAGVLCAEFGTFLEQARESAVNITSSILSAERSICFTQNAIYETMMAEVRKAAASGGRMDGSELKAMLSAEADDMTMFKSCPLLQVCPTILPQENVIDYDYVMFLDRFVMEAATQSETWHLMRAQFSIHCYLHIVLKRMCDIIPMVVRDVMVYKLHDGFLSHVSKALSRDAGILEAAMRESPKERANRERIEGRYAKMEDILCKMRELGLEKPVEDADEDDMDD